MSHHLHMALNTQLQEVAVVTHHSSTSTNDTSQHYLTIGARTNRGSGQQAALSALSSIIHANMFTKL